MKLRKLHIDNYKMFKDFDISFVDENDKTLPIVVLAGVNGSGKTTLLESLLYEESSDLELNIFDIPDEKDGLEVALIYHEFALDTSGLSSNEISKMHEDASNRDRRLEYEGLKIPTYEYLDSIVYFATNTNLEDIKILLPKYIENMIFVKGNAPFDAYTRVTKYINEILKGLDIQIEFDSRDGEGNLFFRNKSGGDKFSIDDLSTGEKTLLSKVLFLYLDDIKDKVILIDEPELSLHPSWQNKILSVYERLAEKNNNQIIIATHSPQVIASAKNEYLRILRKNEEGNIEVINDLKAHGRDINSILFDVMGEVAYRPKEFDDKIDRLHIAIDDRKIEEALKRLEELKKDYGENDEVMMEAQMLIDMFSRDEV